MIEWLPAQSGGVKAVDPKTNTVLTASGSFPASVVNVIPAQAAGQVAQESGLTDKSGWCPVDPTTFELTLQPGVHLVGDSIIGGDMPKSAFSANTQAKACAFAIAAALDNSPPSASHLFNSCYTFLAPNDAFTNAINFKPVNGTFKTTEAFLNKVGESSEKRRQTAHEAVGWYEAFTRDVFG